MKSLKSQLEDSEISKANALKTKQLLQVEINDLQEQLEFLNDKIKIKYENESIM